MDNDMGLEMKAETMQIALTLSSYHDDQPPELEGNSQERSSRRERQDKRGMCVLVFQFAKFSMYLLIAHKSSTGKHNLRDGETTEKLDITNWTCVLIVCLSPPTLFIY